MATYTSWSGAGLTPADRASTEEIAAALEEIVRVEGPMHAELAYRRYLAASGGVRLGSAIKRTLNQVTASLVRRGRLAQIRDQVPGQIEKTLYAPGTPAVAVRDPLHPRDDVEDSECRDVLGDPGLPAQMDRSCWRVVATAVLRASLSDRHAPGAGSTGSDTGSTSPSTWSSSSTSTTAGTPTGRDGHRR